MSSINAESLARYPRRVLDGAMPWHVKFSRLSEHARVLTNHGFNIVIDESTHEGWCRAYVALLEQVEQKLSD